MRCFVDTNVLVYALLDGPRRAPCRELLLAVAVGDVYGTTSTLVIEELWHLEGRRELGLPAGSASAAVGIFPEIVPVDDWVMLAALARPASDGLGTADQVHAATCRSHRLEYLVSADRAFDALPEVRRVEPDTAGIGAWLARAGTEG